MKRVAIVGLIVSLVSPMVHAAGSSSEPSDASPALADALRILLERVETGEVSEDELSILLLEGVAQAVERADSRPTNREKAVLLDSVGSVVDPIDELGRRRSSPVTGNDGIQINGQPVATLGSPLVIPATAFAPDGANPDSYFFSFGAGYIVGNSQNYGCLMAPAYLPHGVTVTDMFSTVFDDDATFNMAVTLRRVDNFTGTTAILATASTAGEFNGIQVLSDFTIENPLVQYPEYSYYVTTCTLSSTHRLYSVRIYFDP